MNGAGQRGGVAAGDMTVALGVVALGAVVLWQTWAIPVSPIYAKVGPTVAPLIAAFGLLAMGVALALSALRGGWQPEDEREASPDRVALGWVIGGLALNVVTIGPLGFTLASILLFTCVARGFGSKKPLRDAGIGAVVALLAYLGFAKTLNINIGAGLVENAIEAVIAMARGR